MANTPVRLDGGNDVACAAGDTQGAKEGAQLATHAHRGPFARGKGRLRMRPVDGVVQLDGQFGVQKLRKGALKPLKQLARVNLCPPPREPRSSAAIRKRS
jgi:hypothetical protein